MTLQELAKEAIEVQDACNIGGVSRRFAQVVQEVRQCYSGPAGGASTGQMNQHPIIQLWASKIHSLVGMGFSEIEEFSKAYDACRQMAGMNTEVSIPA